MEIQKLLERLQELSLRERGGEDVSADVAECRKQLDNLKNTRSGSRFPGAGSSDAVLDVLAAGGSVGADGQVQPHGSKFAGGGEEKSLSAVLTKAMQEGSAGAGGYLVPVQIASEILTIIRARSAVMQMPVTHTGVEKELDISTFATGPTGEYIKEGEPVPVSVPTIGNVPLLKPKELAALVPVSNRLLRHATTNPDLDKALRVELAAVLAARADKAFLIGSGTDPEPKGLLNLTGLTAGPSTGTNGAEISYNLLVDIIAAAMSAGGPMLSPGWIFSPSLIADLRKLKDTQERPLLDSGQLSFDPTGASGRLLGYPFRTSSQLPINETKGSSSNTTAITFGSDWSELWVGEDQELTIETSGEAAYTPDAGTSWKSAFQNRETLFRAVTSHDIGLRRPTFFTVVKGVKVV